MRRPAARIALHGWLTLVATAGSSHAAVIELEGERRMLLPRVAAANEWIALEVGLRLGEDLLHLEAVGAELQRLDGSLREGGAAVLELPAPVSEPAWPGGSLIAARLRLRTRDLAAAGEYPLDLLFEVVPSGERASWAGPPAPARVAVSLLLSRRLAALAASAPGRIEVRHAPWEQSFAVDTRVHVLETGGQSAFPALEVKSRGPAVALDAGLTEAALGLAGEVAVEARGDAAADIVLALRGTVGAGRYRVPLELLSGGAAAPLPLDLEIWVRHPQALLLAAVLLGVLLGLLLAALGGGRERAAARARLLGRGRAQIESLAAAASDRTLSERLALLVERLRKQEARAGGPGMDPARLASETRAEALLALRDLEGRRLGAEGALIALESAWLAAPSDPAEIAAELNLLGRRAEGLRSRLDRGEVGAVEAELDRLRVEAPRAIGEAGRQWLIVARDLLDLLRQQIPQSARVHLMESVRYPLESFAGRIAEGSIDRVRETIVAGRTAATALGEQCFALAYRPVLRDLAELGALLAEFLPENALRPVESARNATELALHPGPLAEPLRPVEALRDYQDAIETALELLAGEAWSGDSWKAVREAVGLREYARVAEAVDSVLRHRSRERTETRRRARVLEIVRLAPRPSPPALRILWDAPPVVGYPVLARVVWLGLEPRRFTVSWTAEGLPAKCEEPNVPSTSLKFDEPGWAALRAVVEVEGESQPLVARTRLRVLPEAEFAADPGAGRPGKWWALTQRAVAAAIATAAGWALFSAAFAGTSRDYAIAIGFGLLVQLAIDGVRNALAARPTATS